MHVRDGQTALACLAVAACLGGCYQAHLLTGSTDTAAWRGDGGAATAPTVGSQIRDPVVQIATGSAHVCAVRASGTVLCWGHNDHGQLGDGTVEDRARPVRVSGIADATAVGAGGDQSCALRADGSVWCWGALHIGDGIHVGEDHREPLRIDVPASTEVVVGATGACATGADGVVRCWGLSPSCGSMDCAFRQPTPVAGALDDARQYALGPTNACAVDRAGAVTCWGDGSFGALGDGSESATYRTAIVEGVSNTSEVSVGGTLSCAVSEGHARCWGLFPNTSTGCDLARHPMASSVPGFDDVVTVRVGGGHACVVGAEGTVRCFGVGTDGQLGTPLPSCLGSFLLNEASPEALQVPIDSARDVACGTAFSCALLRTGAVSCWGNDDHGQLGRGRAGGDPSPAPVALP